MYIAIDLKSFYASVECVERGLDPMKANLVVADESRTDKTICLAVSPSLKARGVGGRARLFEVLQKVRRDEFICAVPRMQLYLDYSDRIVKIYQKYVSQEDIHVYSVDEVFMDVTQYLTLYNMSAHELAKTIIRDVLRQTGITATAGIGTNLYLCKVAMDIVAKHIEADADGVRVAELDEMSYRKKLWNHQPLTDFWRVGRNIANKLNRYGIYTMGDVARQSVNNDELLYSLFGVNAELLIDHAWGWEPCTIDVIKKYRPSSSSLGSGQVLSSPYTIDRARVVMREMAENLSLDLVSKRLVTKQIVINISYDKDSLSEENDYDGEVSSDYYGRIVPKHAHGTINLQEYTSSSREIADVTVKLYDKIITPSLLVRRLNIVAANIESEESVRLKGRYGKQLSLFDDNEDIIRGESERKEKYEREQRIQQVILDIKRQFGRNVILKGMNFSEGATMRERNQQIGGHKA